MDLNTYLDEYLSDPENVHKELRTAREGFTNANITEASWDQIDKMLALLYLYCPENLQVMVHATLDESVMRRSMTIVHRLSVGQNYE